MYVKVEAAKFGHTSQILAEVTEWPISTGLGCASQFGGPRQLRKAHTHTQRQYQHNMR